MRSPRLKANLVRGRVARRGAGLLVALALVWTALGSNFPRVVSTAGENGSSGAASKPTGSTALQFSASALTGKIVFGSGDRISVMNADGTNQTKLEPPGEAPAFSPDGTRIAFIKRSRAPGCELEARIFVMNADGTSPTRLSGSAEFSDLEPAFSPDGSKIVFASDRDGNFEVYVMNADGTNQTRLTNNRTDDFNPAFSPDGSKIVFQSRRDGNDEVYVMNANGTGQTNLTNNPGTDGNPTFSPDGSKIAFTSLSSGQSDIWIMNADGTGQTPLTTNPANDRAPVFSPDGSMIAFDSRRDGNFEIYVMNADGTNQTRLTNNAVLDIAPSWAPGNVVVLSVNAVSVVEGNSGTSDLTFTVSKAGPTTQNVTVRVDTADGTTNAPDDYAPIVNQTLTFLPNDTTKTVSVTVNGDTTIEPNERFGVNLSNATNALIRDGDGDGDGTITNDDFTRPIRTLPNLQQVVIFEQTRGPNPHVKTFAPNAPQLAARLPDPLTATSHDFSEFDEEYYDFFYSDANGTPNPDGDFLTIEGVWRNRSVFCCVGFGGMNINEVELRFQNGTDRGDFVSSFVRGSICNPNNPDFPEQCIPGSEARAVDNNLNTFPRLGHTSDMNLNERFRLTIGFNGISGTPAPSSLQFGAATYNAAEGTPSVTINVTRQGDASREASVNYATTDTPGGSQVNQTATNGTASERQDYTAALGRLRFAPGEASKTFDILITDDRFDDDNESFQITLSDAVGAALGSQSTATVHIADNDVANCPSPVREASFDSEHFVRQQYADFLNRAPDDPGLDFWVGQTTGCGNSDLLVCRINVSAAFFLSIENQESGYLVHRAHKAAFGNLPGKPVPLTLREYLAGSRQIGDGVQVGVGNWQQQLEANKVAFFNEFVTRSQFTALYNSLTHAQFVDALNAQANAGGALSATERDALVNGLNGGTMTRAQVLRAVAEDSDFAQSEKNRAFVLAQYFGYLRRDPDAAPDTNFDGYNFWLAKLNLFDGNFIQAEMVRAFISSIEYGDRFGL